MVASWDTGNVLDVEVLSKHCQVCAAHRDMDGSSEMNSWTGGRSITHLVKPIIKGHHQQWSLMEPSTSCEANYKGSSPAMESRGGPQHLVKPIIKGRHQQWSLMEPSTSGEANYKGSSPAMESHGALNI